MSPGREALAEAARLEAARVYGTTLREHEQQRPEQAHRPAVLADDIDTAFDKRQQGAA